MTPVEMLAAVRRKIGETTAQNWTDASVLEELNHSQWWLASKIATIEAGMFPATYTFSVVANQELYKLPPRLQKIDFVEYTASGVTERLHRLQRSKRQAFNDNLVDGYYLDGRQIGILNTPVSAVTNAVKIYYQEVLPKLHYGTMAAATRLASTAEPINDYYNGCEIAIYGGTGAGDRAFISDYVKTDNVITLDADGWVQGSTPDTTSQYYIVCKIPAEYHELMVLRAVIALLAEDEDSAQRFKDAFHEALQDFENTFDRSTEARYVGA